MQKKVGKVLPKTLAEQIKAACDGKKTFNEVRKEFPMVSRSAVYSCIVKNDLPIKLEKTYNRRRQENAKEGYFDFSNFEGQLAWS